MSDPVDSAAVVVVAATESVKEVLSDIVEKGHDALAFVNKVESFVPEAAPKVVPWIHRLLKLFRLCRSAQSVKVASPPGDEPPALEPSP